MTRVAAVDCGTNTIRLLVADLDAAAGTQRTLVREARIVRLGEGVDRTGRLAEAALARAFRAVEEYAALVARHEVRAVRFCATSAVRDAERSEVLDRGVRERLGVSVRVLSGDEEARLTFEGATRSLPEVAGPVLVVDVGGGSTEVILGDPQGRIRAATSLDIGSVRLTERLLVSDPPTRAEVTAAGQLVEEVMDGATAAGLPLAEARTVVGVAGTVTTLARVALGLVDAEGSRLHQTWLARAALHELTERLLAMREKEREALGVPEGRSDVVAAGALITDRLVRRTRVERLLVSVRDLLDAIAWSILDEDDSSASGRVHGRT